MLEESLATVAKAVEEQLDDEIAKLDKLGDDDLERLRERRMQQLKKQATMRQQWLAQGHGEYQEIFNEKEFFAKVKLSDRVICHFYRENWPCKVSGPQWTLLALHPSCGMRSMQLVRDDCQLEIVFVAIVLIMFGAHLNILFIIKVNILELLNGHIGTPNSVDF